MVKCSNFDTMKKKIQEYETVKLKKEIVAKVKANKKKKGTPVSVYFEIAAMEKLKCDALQEKILASENK